jgi:hypothetical protein
MNTMKAVFWFVAPCGLEDVYRHFALKMETARTYEKLQSFYQTTRR